MSQCLTAGELSSMQSDLASLLPSTAVVLGGSETTASGRTSLAWVASGTYACRLAYREGNASMGDIAGKAEAVGTWVLTLGTAAIIDAGDRVTVGGHTYDVQTVHYTPGETIAKRAMLREAQ